ncbi:MAG: dual specificity protein phosphatase family protein [Deltaproteobacteria bacterium]|nr:dual specificity protein phosphatase family protein [Deltaproteobacteria bacterium]
MKIEPYWIEGPWPGKLAIVPRPRGGDWLEDEVRAWRQNGLEVVVSLLTRDEDVDLDLVQEAKLSQAQGLEFFAFPILDRSVPLSRRATLELVKNLDGLLAEGKNVAVHCRQGIGRSAVVAACVLIFAGLPPDTAFRRIGIARGCVVPETAEQREWTLAFARELPDISLMSCSV